jgi:hypothetical protein
MNKEGFYLVQYQGQSGYGAGMLVLDTNMVVGADPLGGRYDGTYTYNPATRSLDIVATITIPPGVWAVNGLAATNQPVQFPLSVSIPQGHLQGFRHRAQTPAGPIDLVLTKVRDFPT